MSTRAKALLQEFRSLSAKEQLVVYEAIAKGMTPDGYEPLSDDELIAIAAQTFSALDEEESRAQSG